MPGWLHCRNRSGVIHRDNITRSGNGRAIGPIGLSLGASIFMSNVGGIIEESESSSDRSLQKGRHISMRAAPDAMASKGRAMGIGCWTCSCGSHLAADWRENGRGFTEGEQPWQPAHAALGCRADGNRAAKCPGLCPQLCRVRQPSTRCSRMGGRRVESMAAASRASS